MELLEMKICYYNAQTRRTFLETNRKTCATYMYILNSREIQGSKNIKGVIAKMLVIQYLGYIQFKPMSRKFWDT